MKEIYKAKRPKRIMFGDPQYFEEFKGNKLKSLTVDCKPPAHFSARVMLDEFSMEGYPNEIIRTMSLYLAPEKTMDVYLQGMKYESQGHTEKDIGVDTARYYFRVDDRDDFIHTGGDGYWGDYQELFRKIDGKKILDAVIITALLPDYETTESMRQRAEYFFPDMQLVENAAEQDDTPQMNM